MIPSFWEEAWNYFFDSTHTVWSKCLSINLPFQFLVQFWLWQQHLLMMSLLLSSAFLLLFFICFCYIPCFRTTEPAPTIISSPTVIPLARTDWLPINTRSPTLQSPFTIVPVEMWHWFPITASCSILQKVLMMQFSPIWAPALTTAFWHTARIPACCKLSWKMNIEKTKQSMN